MEGTESTPRRRRRAWLWAGGGLALATTVGIAGCSMLGPEFEPEVASPEMARRALESRFVAGADGARIHYVVAAGGEAAPGGSAVAFVHGSPGTWEAWSRYLGDPELRARALLLALDRPGFGASSRGRAEPSLARQADAVGRVLAAEGAERAVIVGHSLGGPVAARLAVDAPGRVAALVLFAPSIDPALERRRWYNVAGSLRVVQWLLPVDWITSNREIWPLRAELEALAPRLAGITAPTLVVQGGRDELVPAANADFLERRLRAEVVEVRRIPDAGHFFVWQAYGPAREAILDALGRVDA